VLLELAGVTGDARFERRGEAVMEAFAGAIPGSGIRGASYLEVARLALARR
jgi:hypothetical protein